MQGIYRDDKRDGPGLLSYADGCSDVGLWKYHQLVRIGTAVNSPFSLSELGYDLPPGSADRPAPWKMQRVPHSRQEMLENAGVDVASPPFDYPWSLGVEELAAAVLHDFLPPTCNAADLTALDHAFVADDYDTFNAVKNITRRRSHGDGSRRFSFGSQVQTSPMAREHGSPISVLKTAGEAGAADESESGKQHGATPPDSAITKPDARGESTGLPVAQEPSPKVASTSPALSELTAAERTGHKQPALSGSSPAKDAQLAHSGSSGLPGVQQPPPKPALTTPTTPGPSESTAAERTGQKQPTLGSSPAKVDAQAARGGSAGLPGVQYPSPKVASTSPGLGELTQVGSGHKQATLPGLSTPKGDAQPVPGRSATSHGNSDWSGVDGEAAVSDGKTSRKHRLAQAPMAVLAGIEAVLRGQPSSEAVELGLDAGRSGPLQLMSERFITAAGRGDVQAVGELLDGGLVSTDVADSSGLTAVLAASVRIRQ